MRVREGSEAHASNKEGYLDEFVLDMAVFCSDLGVLLRRGFRLVFGGHFV